MALSPLTASCALVSCEVPWAEVKDEDAIVGLEVREGMDGTASGKGALVDSDDIAGLDPVVERG